MKMLCFIKTIDFISVFSGVGGTLSCLGYMTSLTLKIFPKMWAIHLTVSGIKSKVSYYCGFFPDASTHSCSTG